MDFRTLRGLVACTLLTLMVLPAVYALAHRDQA
jgi:Cu/Ag efflux pump CusA